jgi:hypothetical protein
VNASGLPKRLSGLEVGLLSGEGNFPHVDDFCLVGPFTTISFEYVAWALSNGFWLKKRHNLFFLALGFRLE